MACRILLVLGFVRASFYKKTLLKLISSVLGLGNEIGMLRGCHKGGPSTSTIEGPTSKQEIAWAITESHVTKYYAEPYN